MIPIYIHDSYTGMGVQLELWAAELWAWVFNAVRVSLQSSNKQKLQDIKKSLYDSGYNTCATAW